MKERVLKNRVKAYEYLKIIERNTGRRNREKIEPKLTELEKELSKEQLNEAHKFVQSWSPHQTELTIKAFAGIEESWRIVEKAQGK